MGTKAYFEEVSARKYFVEPHIPAFANFPQWTGRDVLEVGCGIGTAAVDFIRSGASYTGVDLSEESIDIARKRLSVFGLSGQLITCDAERLAEYVPLDAFDLVYSFGVIHHSPNQRAIVEGIRKVVRRNGEFRCMLYARNSWKGVMIEAGYDQPEAQSGCPIATTYTREMVAELLRGLFEIKEITQAHIFPYVIDKYVEYEYELQPWFKAMPAGMLQALERRFGWHMLITAVPV